MENQIIIKSIPQQKVYYRIGAGEGEITVAAGKTTGSKACNC